MSEMKSWDDPAIVAKAARLAVEKLSTGNPSFCPRAKKREKKRGKSPCTPLRRKEKGKEIKPEYISKPGLTACVCARVRVRGVSRKRLVAAAVDDALVAFNGSRGPAPSDEALWANFAWNFGYDTLLDLIYRGKSEMRQHRSPVPDCDQPKVLQNLINRLWHATNGGAR